MICLEVHYIYQVFHCYIVKIIINFKWVWIKITQQEAFEVLEANLGGKSETITIESDDHIEEIFKALSSHTRRKILRQLLNEAADVSKIASDLNMTEANISAQIKKLEKAGLIECEYSSGAHGVRKISKSKYSTLNIKF